MYKIFMEPEKIQKVITDIPQELSIIIRWKEIVGEQIGKISIPSTIKDDTIMIYAKNSSWTYELGFHKKTIIDKLNKFLKTPIKKVRILTTPYIKDKKQIQTRNKKAKITPIDKSNQFVELGTLNMPESPLKDIAEKVLWKSVCTQKHSENL